MIPLLAAAAIGLLAMLVRGLTGFGAALIMSPLLLFFFDTKTAVVTGGMIQLLTGVQLAYQVRNEIVRPYLKILLPIGAAGLVGGAFILTNLDGTWLKRALGLVTVAFALRTMWTLYASPGITAIWPLWLGYPAGAISGVLGGAFGTSGPPVVIFLENQIRSKVALRATLIVYFFALDFMRMMGYLSAQLITSHVVQVSAIMLPAALVGVYLGSHWHVRVGERAFRWLVSGVLCATGALLVVGG